MRFATRVFAFCFIPFAALLGLSFWMLQFMVQRTVKDELRSSMRDKQFSMTRMRSKNESQVARFLRFASENAALKAGLQLLNAEPASPDARRTVEDQLRELSARLEFGILAIANSDGVPVAGIVRDGNQAASFDAGSLLAAQGLVNLHGRLYSLASAPIDQGDVNLGFLSIGDTFELSDFGLPVVLFHNGGVAGTSASGVARKPLEAALRPCLNLAECDIRLNGAAYLSMKVESAALGAGYSLRSLQNVDQAGAPVKAVLRNVFLTASIGAVLAALVFSAGASRSIVKPLKAVVWNLHKSEAAGSLLELPTDPSRIDEIQDLIRGFNRAGAAIRDARDGLHSAYVEFVGSLANALDARDPYTAGHSHRVSRLSVAIARNILTSEEHIETIRVGALLHDIGKIGIADQVLQKPGKLTPEEFSLIERHPTIGRRILQGVHGFSPYLSAVELHHENWDGTGYPHGLMGKEVPLEARIIHVADAYDAMTTDRPYRRGFTHDRAIAIIRQNAGTQFDPEISAAMVRMFPPDAEAPVTSDASLSNLAAALQPHESAVQRMSEAWHS